jgi:hypothetical protein
VFTFEKTRAVCVTNTCLASNIRLDRPERKKETFRKILHTTAFIVILLLLMCDIKATDPIFKSHQGSLGNETVNSVTITKAQHGEP